jgi:hypothetical protein
MPMTSSRHQSENTRNTGEGIMRIRTGLVASAFIALMLNGCTTITSVKEVMENPTNYLNENFTEAKLTEPVKAKLGITGQGSVKRSIRVEVNQVLIEGDKKTEFSNVYHFYVLSNGLVRNWIDNKANGISSSYSFRLNHGPLAVVYQFANLGATNATFIDQYKSFSILDEGLANPKPASTYVAEYAVSPIHQVANFYTNKTVCKTGEFFEASTLHKKLAGKALTLDCERTGVNGQTFQKGQYTYLQDLGIMIDQSSSTTTTKRTYSITDVAVM